jgi:hypothetical protein
MREGKIEASDTGLKYTTSRRTRKNHEQASEETSEVWK